jgi:hypothetical protein
VTAIIFRRFASVLSLVMLPFITLSACTWIEAPTDSAGSDQVALDPDHPLPPADCPVTIPNGRTPAGEEPSPYHFGNDAVVTALWPNGVVLVDFGMIELDGSLGLKWPWWREIRGQLTIEGYAHDDGSMTLSGEVPDGYGDSGFQPSGILFPSEGCWKVTARLEHESLTFVTWVQKR